MRQRSQRRTVWIVGIVGVAILVGASVGLRDLVLEQWYLWQLESAEEDAQWQAVERLGAMKSERAVPGLVDLMTQLATADPGVAMSFLVFAFPAEPPRPGTFHVATMRSLAAIGPAAVPPLTKAFAQEHYGVRLSAAFTLGKIGPEAASAISALEKAHLSAVESEKKVSIGASSTGISTETVLRVTIERAINEIRSENSTTPTPQPSQQLTAGGRKP